MLIVLTLVAFCVQNVAESLTDSQIDHNIQVLKNSSVWKSNVKLQNYIQKQWLDNNKFEVIPALQSTQ